MSMAISGMGGGMPQVMSGASMRMPPAQKMSNVFDQIDTSGSGTISKSQFEQAFQSLKMPQSFKSMGADAIFSKLDPNGTGSVSKQDFVNGMKSMMSQVRQHHHAGGATQNTQSSTSQSLASSIESLNSLGSESGSIIKTTA